MEAPPTSARVSSSAVARALCKGMVCKSTLIPFVVVMKKIPSVKFDVLELVWRHLKACESHIVLLGKETAETQVVVQLCAS